jgi:hypothetical protein
VRKGAEPVDKDNRLRRIDSSVARRYVNDSGTEAYIDTVRYRARCAVGECDMRRNRVIKSGEEAFFVPPNQPGNASSRFMFACMDCAQILEGFEPVIEDVPDIFRRRNPTDTGTVADGQQSNPFVRDREQAGGDAPDAGDDLAA